MAMKIGARLAATFCAVLVLLLVICVTVSVQMAHMNENTENIVNKQAARLRDGNLYKNGTLSVAVLVYRLLEETTPEAEQATSDQLQAQIKINATVTQDVQTQIDTPAARAAFDH